MRKIIGVTVGTPTSPQRMENELNPVKTVNGVKPDKNGNVEISTGGSDNTIITRTITLSAGSWYNRGLDGIVYELEFPEVTADENKTHVTCSVIPDEVMAQEVARCDVRYATQEDGYLWFGASERPTIDIDMNIRVEISNGDSYTLTEEDKATIVSAVLAAMPVAEELSV